MRRPWLLVASVTFMWGALALRPGQGSAGADVAPGFSGLATWR